MKKFFTLLCAAVMMLSTANAKLILTESFDREVGTLNSGINNSMGWNTTDWWSFSGTSNYIKVDEGSLSYAGYKTTGEGNKADLWSTGADDFRQFGTNYTSGKVYLAAIINVDELKQGTISDYFLCLGDATPSNMYARLYTKSVKEGDNFIGFQLGIAKFTETNTYVGFTETVYSPKTNYLVVVEYEFVNGDKNDIARLYVNPTKTTKKATLECVQDVTNTLGSPAGANSKNDASKIASVNLRQGTNTPKRVFVDEIKVATAWDDLFETGGTVVNPTPEINAASSVDFGSVTLGEAAEKTLTVSGSDLKGAITVESSSDLLVPAVTSISKTDAEAGYSLKLTLTPSEAGAGSATLTLSSQGAESQQVSVSWTASAPTSNVANLAALKELEAWGDPVGLESHPIVVRVTDEGAAVQDDSYALFIVDGDGDFLNLKVGDQLELDGLQMIEAEYGVEGYLSAYAGSISVLSSNNALQPFEVSIAELEKYGPAYVKVSGVTFPEDAETFAAGNIAISQSTNSVNMYIPAACDIIGEDVPASADAQGCVMTWYGLKLQLNASADLTNRIAKGGQEVPNDNLILNHSFEDFMGCSWDEWSMALGSGSANSTSKLDGEYSLMLNPTSITTTLDQGVLLNDADYAAGSKFTLTLNYKVQSMPEGGNLALDCYWEAAGGGNSDEIEAHESDILRVNLESGSDWLQKVLVTTKPAKSAYFRVRVTVPKNAKVLFDDFSLYYTPSTDPFIDVTPLTLSAVSADLGATAVFTTVHIRQGNLNGPTTFELSYNDADQFQLSQTSLAADQTECDLVITYAPTKTGSHTAYLNIDNLSHTTLHKSIKLEGTCNDPSAQPEVTVTPSTLADFEAVVGQTQQQSVTVARANCTDYLYLRMDHITGAAFTVDGTMLSKSGESDVTITFRPQEAGSFQSTLTIYSQSNEFEPIVLTLNGTGKPASAENIDWQEDFSWNNLNPLALMNEHFDNAEHNKTLIVDGWQNVAAADARPWWGLDESQTSLFDGDGKYAKATAYQYGKESTGQWEMWLVTPALDYLNAASKMFTFSVMADYLADEDNQATLEIYYLDPYSGQTLFQQDLTSSFAIPATSDENLTWRTFFLDLAPYAETMADVFHMAFRYTGPNGADGAVTYYIDDVSWGRTDLPVISVDLTSIEATVKPNEQTLVGQINVSTSNLSNAISISVKGANYNKFKLSDETLPAEGGTFSVNFESDQEGVHEAYLELSSPEAATVFIPMAVLCSSNATGIESHQHSAISIQKIFRNGQLIIIRDGKEYNALGHQLVL